RSETPLPSVVHNADALPQGDTRLGPAQNGCPVGRLCHFEVVHAGDMLKNAEAGGVPNVDAESKMRFGLHGGQVHWTGPPPALFITDVVAYASPTQFLVLLFGLPLFTFSVLALAQWGSGSSCHWQFPKWFGCVLGDHDSLAAGLIGASGALFAAWIAWT